MNPLSKFWVDAWDNYRKIERDLKECERVSPKQYGEHLQKKRKRCKRK